MFFIRMVIACVFFSSLILTQRPLVGQCSFYGPQHFPDPMLTTFAPTTIATGDFTGDENTDIVVGNSSLFSVMGDFELTVTVIAGNGDGTYSGRFVTDLNLSSPIKLAEIVVGDFNEDSELDVLANTGRRFYPMLGNGDGTFKRLDFVEQFASRGLFAADFNGDGHLDTISASSSRVRIYAGDGTGNFAPLAEFEIDDFIRSMLVVDLDGDTDLDFVLPTQSFGGSTAVVINEGNRSFSIRYELIDSLTAASGDLNGDGRVDLLVENSILFGDGDGNFTAGPKLEVPGRFEITDLDDDQIQDVIAYSDGGFNVLLGLGNGRFAEPTKYPTAGRIESIAIADLNGDSSVDLAVSQNESDLISQFVNKGSGTFQNELGGFEGYPIGSEPEDLVLADLDSNGRLDLVITNLLNASISVLLANNDGTYQPAVDYSVGQFPEGSAVGDFNADGIPDIAVLNEVDTSVSILLGNGNGTLQSALEFPTFVVPFDSRIFAVDVTGDSILDIVTGNGLVVPGIGDGTFDLPLFQFTDSLTLAIGDVNGDTISDLVGINFNQFLLTAAFGQGDGTFQDDIVLFEDVLGVEVDDFDFDSLLDIAVIQATAENNGRVVTLHSVANRGRLSRTASTDFRFNHLQSDVVFDADGDNDLDLTHNAIWSKILCRLPNLQSKSWICQSNPVCIIWRYLGNGRR